MKNPNGYGTVTYLGSKRRKPYAVRVTVNGNRYYLSYHKTRREAMEALGAFHANKYDVSNMTVLQCYEGWIDSIDVSDRTRELYAYAFSKCTAIYNRKIRDIKSSDLQGIVDGLSGHNSVQKSVINVLTQLFKYAVRKEYISSSPASFDKVKTVKSDMHYRFTDKEIDLLWENSSDINVKIVLVYIYTGVRKLELLNLLKEDVDMEAHTFFIKEGKTLNSVRTVPVADKIYPFFSEFMQMSGDRLLPYYGHPNNFTKSVFNKALIRSGCYYYEQNGKRDYHKLHDTRHTFTSMWYDKQLNETYRRIIQGHALEGIGEQVYAHVSSVSLLNEVNNL